MAAEHIIHMQNGRLADDTPYSAVQQIMADAVAAGNAVIHFHGGLVNESSARGIAQKLTGVYEEAGAYPIFPVWESGLLETLSNNLGELASEEFFQILLKRLLDIVRRKFSQNEGDRSAGMLPTAYDHDASPQPDPGLTPLSDAEMLSLRQELQQDAELLLATQAVSGALRNPDDIARDLEARSAEPVIASARTLMDPEAVERLIDRPDATSRGFFSIAKIATAIVTVAGKVIVRYIQGRDHGFHATVVEEILREFYLANVGGIIWHQMKKDTKESFGDDPQRFGGTALLTELGKHLQAGARPKITLIGHSTGAVYIAHLLEKADTLLPADFAFDIILLAPASTFDLTADTFIPCKHRINALRIFTMTDGNEKADHLVPLLYPHSLLYFVSGVVEPDADTPIIGMQRYYDAEHYKAGAFGKVEAFRQFVKGMENSIVWSVAAGGAGLETAALKHGDFDDDPKTLASIRHIIRHGL